MIFNSAVRLRYLLLPPGRKLVFVVFEDIPNGILMDAKTFRQSFDGLGLVAIFSGGIGCLKFVNDGIVPQTFIGNQLVFDQEIGKVIRPRQTFILGTRSLIVAE
jgi:hypothetical protein